MIAVFFLVAVPVAAVAQPAGSNLPRCEAGTVTRTGALNYDAMGDRLGDRGAGAVAPGGDAGTEIRTRNAVWRC